MNEMLGRYVIVQLHREGNCGGAILNQPLDGTTDFVF